MQTVIETLFMHHDLRLVVMAAIVCALSAFAGITLLHHARRTAGAMKYAWLGIAAISVGSGIWSTHFIAMLSFSPGMPTGYDIPLTLVSLAVAIVIVGGGLLYATIATRRSDAVLAGAVVGIGISSMHYIGMTALLLGGEIKWDPLLVSSSLLLGMLLGSVALAVGTVSSSMGWRLRGAALLTLAICSMHFTAMGAAGLENCFPIVTEADATPIWLSLVVATGSILILLFALGCIALDMHERRRDEAEAERMRGLADAAVEGLIVVKDGAIVTANESFLSLVGAEHIAIVDHPLSDFFSVEALLTLSGQSNETIEIELTSAAGTTLPVEAILRRVDFGGRPHQAIAVRDLSTRKKAEQHIRFLAHHDPLTGLPNRASFTRALDDEILHAQRHQQSFAVLALDLDRFKEVNDLFGHPAGDALLKRVAAAIQSVAAGRGSAARLGGDEFAVLLSDVQSPARAGYLAEMIMDAFVRDNEATDSGAMISASIGIALYPGDGEDAEALVSHADTALYRAKQDGRGIYRFYETEMGARARPPAHGARSASAGTNCASSISRRSTSSQARSPVSKRLCAGRTPSGVRSHRENSCP